MDCRKPKAIEFRSKLGFKEQISANKNNENICKRKSIATTFYFKL